MQAAVGDKRKAHPGPDFVKSHATQTHPRCAAHVDGEDRRAFTLVEILVVLAIISILASLLLTAVVRTRELARRTACASNLRQIYIGLELYRQQWGEMPPDINTNVISRRTGRVGLGYLVPDYVGDSSVFYCPGASRIRLGEASVDMDLIGRVEARCSYVYELSIHSPFRNAYGSYLWWESALVADYNGPDNLNHKGKFANELESDGSVRLNRSPHPFATPPP